MEYKSWFYEIFCISQYKIYVFLDLPISNVLLKLIFKIILKRIKNKLVVAVFAVPELGAPDHVDEEVGGGVDGEREVRHHRDDRHTAWRGVPTLGG